MKNAACLFFLLLISTAAMAQKTFEFDYFTIYDYSEDGKSQADSRELTYSNSTDPNIHLIVLEDKGKVFHSYLLDKSQNQYYEFELPKSFSEVEKKTLYVSKSLPMNFEMCQKKNNFYELSTISDTIHIKRFKNEKKRKLINEAVVVVSPTAITKFQKFNFGPFRNPLWCGKYSFESEGLITYSYFIEKGKKVHFRKLQQIKQTNFTVTVRSQDNTKK